MPTRLSRPLALLLLALGATARADDSMESDRVKSTLRDMDKTSTWYHDDLFGEFAGFRYYAQKRYAEALHYFEGPASPAARQRRAVRWRRHGAPILARAEAIFPSGSDTSAQKEFCRAPVVSENIAS